MKPIQRHCVGFVLLVLTFSGCGAPEEERVAEAAADRHYVRMERNQWDDVLDQYDPLFFANTSVDAWRTELATLKSRLGHYRGRELRSSGRQTYAGFAGTERRLILTYRVHYEKGDIMETIGLLDREKTGTPLIVMHSFAPTAETRAQYASR